MFLRKCITAILALVILFTGVVNTANGVQQRDPCIGSLPDTLEKLLEKQYPGWKIVNLKMLNPYHKKLYLTNKKAICPGVAKVNFYGDGREVFAIVLTRRSENGSRSRLIISRQNESGQWYLITLDDNTSGPPPVVVVGPPGEYEQVYKERFIRAQQEVIVYIGYESWAVLYFWNGKKIEELQISD